MSSECDEISGTIDDTCSQRKFTNDKTYDFFDDIKKGPQSKIENGVKRNDTFRLNDASYKDHEINDNNHNNETIMPWSDGQLCKIQIAREGSSCCCNIQSV